MQIENFCINCMKEKESPHGACPYCGFDDQTYEMHGGELPPFTILNGRYLVGRVIGRGGFGIVYIGFDLFLNISVAIKELFIENVMFREHTTNFCELSIGYSIGNDYVEEVKRKFITEARTLAKLQDTAEGGIVQVKDLFEENGTAYMIMELLVGETLKDHLEQHGNMDFAELAEMLKPVLESLKKIHAAGIIHRDISPDNIMLLKDHRVKLLDFGGVKELTQDHQKSVMIQVKKGYTPIEQYQVEGKIGPWTDVYALCATIYKCITGELLPEPLEIKEKGIEKPSKLGISIPPKAEAALMKGLETDYQKRLQDTDALYNAFYNEEKKKKKKVNRVIVATVAIALIAGVVFIGGKIIGNQTTAPSFVRGLQGYYKINEVNSAELCWKIPSDYISGAALQSAQPDGEKNEYFQVISAGEDSYHILNADNGLALTLVEDAITGETKIVQQELTDVTAQEWYARIDETTGYYRFCVESDDGDLVYVSSEGEQSDVNAVKWDSENEESTFWQMEPIGEVEVKNLRSAYLNGDVIDLTEGVYTFANQEEVLGVSGNYTNDGYGLYLEADENHNYQKFYVTSEENGNKNIRALHSNSLIGTLMEETGAGAQLVQWNGVIENGNQEWTFLYYGTDQVIIRSNTGFCIGRAEEGTEAILCDYNENNANIIWKISTTEKNSQEEEACQDVPDIGTVVDVTEGTYMLQETAEEGRLLGIRGGYSDDGVDAVLTDYSEQNSNKYYVLLGENGYYAIVATHINKYLAPDENGILRQYPFNKGEQERYQWQFLYGGEGIYLIQNKNGLCISNTGVTGESASLLEYDTENSSEYWTLVWSERDDSEADPLTEEEAMTPVGSTYQLEEGTYLIQAVGNEGLLLGIEDNGISEGANLIETDYEEQNCNRFYLIADGNGKYALRASHTNMYIAPDENGELHQYYGEDNEGFVWQILYAGTDMFFIQHENGKCIGTSTEESFSGAIAALQDYNTENQTLYWKFIWTEKDEQEITPTEPVNSEVGEAVELQEGTYSFSSSLNTDILMTVTGGYWDDGTELICQTEEEKNSQKFFVVALSDSSDYAILAAHSNKRLEINAETGYVYQQYTDEVSSDTSWKFIYAGEGSYFIQNENGMCLDIENDQAEIGAHIILSAYDENDAGQKWVVSWTEYNAEEVTVPIYEGDFVDLKEGVYELSSSLDTNMYCAISQDESQERQAAILWQRTGDDTQQFRFEKLLQNEEDSSQQRYRISQVGSDKYLTIDVEINQIYADTWSGDSSQLWQIVYGGFGTYLLRSDDGKFLAVPDMSPENGEGLTIVNYEGVDTATIKWFMSICEGIS